MGLPCRSLVLRARQPGLHFLGAETDFLRLNSRGVVSIGVTAARCDSVADAVEHFLDWNRLSTAEASRLAGRLFFVSTWTAGRWGRATFRTILDLACRGSPGGNISRAERRALRGASLPGSSGNGDYGRWACPRHAPPRR